MSGDGKRGAGHWPQATAPILDSTEAAVSRVQELFRNGMEAVAELQVLVGEYERIVRQHEMEKIKTIGDAFLATVGLLYRTRSPTFAPQRYSKHCRRLRSSAVK